MASSLPEPNDLEGMKVADLKEVCKKCSLKVSGTKAELVSRLREHILAAERGSKRAAPAPTAAALDTKESNKATVQAAQSEAIPPEQRQEERSSAPQTDLVPQDEKRTGGELPLEPPTETASHEPPGDALSAVPTNEISPAVSHKEQSVSAGTADTATEVVQKVEPSSTPAAVNAPQQPRMQETPTATNAVTASEEARREAPSSTPAAVATPEAPRKEELPSATSADAASEEARTAELSLAPAAEAASKENCGEEVPTAPAANVPAELQNGGQPSATQAAESGPEEARVEQQTVEAQGAAPQPAEANDFSAVQIASCPTDHQAPADASASPTAAAPADSQKSEAIATTSSVDDHSTSAAQRSEEPRMVTGGSSSSSSRVPGRSKEEGRARDSPAPQPASAQTGKRARNSLFFTAPIAKPAQEASRRPLRRIPPFSSTCSFIIAATGAASPHQHVKGGAVPPWCAAAVAEAFGPTGPSESAQSTADEECDLQARRTYCAALQWKLRPPRVDRPEYISLPDIQAANDKSQSDRDHIMANSDRASWCQVGKDGLSFGHVESSHALGSKGGPAVKLGFVVLMQDEVRAVKRLVNRLWRPEHHFVLHVDAKAEHGGSAQSMRSWAQSRGSNVEVLDRPLFVVRGAFSQVLARLRALSLLLRRPGWSFALLLTATHYPIRPLEHLENYLWLRNLSQVGVAPEWMPPEGPTEGMRGLGTRIAYECGASSRLLRNQEGTPVHLPWPPHPNISFAYGSAHAVLRRDLAEAAVAAMGKHDTGTIEEADTRMARVALAFTRLLVQPDEAFWQFMVLNSDHCARAHLLCDLTSPIHTFGPEEKRTSGAAFQIASPRVLSEKDLPQIRLLQSDPASVALVFIRKVADNGAGHRLRSLLDSALVEDTSAGNWSNSSWSLGQRVVQLYSGQNASSRSVEIRARMPAAGLGPWGLLLSGGRELEVSYPDPFCAGGRGRLEVHERLFVPIGRSAAVVAVRIGSSDPRDFSQGAWDVLGRDVGCLAASQSVTAAIYWAPRNFNEVQSGALLHGSFFRGDGVSFSENDSRAVDEAALVRVPPHVGFTVGNLTLHAHRVRPGNWTFVLERLYTQRLGGIATGAGVRRELLVRVPFKVYKNPSRLRRAQIEEHFQIRRQSHDSCG